MRSKKRTAQEIFEEIFKKNSTVKEGDCRVTSGAIPSSETYDLHKKIGNGHMEGSPIPGTKPLSITEEDRIAFRKNTRYYAIWGPKIGFHILSFHTENEIIEMIVEKLKTLEDPTSKIPTRLLSCKVGLTLEEFLRLSVISDQITEKDNWVTFYSLSQKQKSEVRKMLK